MDGFTAQATQSVALHRNLLLFTRASFSSCAARAVDGGAAADGDDEDDCDRDVRLGKNLYSSHAPGDTICTYVRRGMNGSVRLYAEEVIL